MISTAADFDRAERLADEYCEMVRTGSAAKAEVIFADDVKFWQNTTGNTIDRDETIARTLALSAIPEFRYENIRRNVFVGGFVQRHDACGNLGDRNFRVPICIVVDVHGDKIMRVEEYFDSTQDPRQRPST